MSDDDFDGDEDFNPEDDGGDDSDFGGSKKKTKAKKEKKPKAEKKKKEPAEKKAATKRKADTSASSSAAPQSSGASSSQSSIAAASPAKRQKVELKEVRAAAPAASSSAGAAGGGGNVKVIKAISESAAPQAIVDYLAQQNRPYSALQVFDNLHGAIKKPAVQRVLDMLAEQGKISMKAFKKNKIYWAKQDGSAVDQKELDQMDAEIEEKSEAVADLKEKIGELQRSLTDLLAQPTNASLDEELATLRKEVAAKEDRVKKMQAGGAQQMMTQDQLDAVQQAFNDEFTKWRSWKKACAEIVDTVLEGQAKKPKKFMEEQGLETDEEANVKIQTYEPFYRKVEKKPVAKPVARAK